MSFSQIDVNYSVFSWWNLIKCDRARVTNPSHVPAPPNDPNGVRHLSILFDDFPGSAGIFLLCASGQEWSNSTCECLCWSQEMQKKSHSLSVTLWNPPVIIVNWMNNSPATLSLADFNAESLSAILFSLGWDSELFGSGQKQLNIFFSSVAFAV